MSNDELLLKKRLTELAEKSYSQGTYTFSNFLGLAEQDVLSRIERDIRHVPKALYGGAEGCQRVMVRFGDEDLCGYDLPFPIVCLKAAPTAPKYADKLTHRDILGALMNLGITREQYRRLTVDRLDYHAHFIGVVKILCGSHNGMCDGS